MDISSDDEMYRVDAVWLGPPKATVPWRARYVAWGMWLIATLLTLSVLRLWVGFGLFPAAWSVVIGVALARLIGKKITHERPLRDVARMAVRELTTPRQSITATGGAATATDVRIRGERPRRQPQPRRHAPRSTRGQETPRG